MKKNESVMAVVAGLTAEEFATFMALSAKAGSSLQKGTTSSSKAPLFMEMYSRLPAGAMYKAGSSSYPVVSEREKEIISIFQEEGFSISRTAKRVLKQDGNPVTSTNINQRLFGDKGTQGVLGKMKKYFDQNPVVAEIAE